MDFIGHVEVPETKIDSRVARHDRDEMVSNTLNTFTSATINALAATITNSIRTPKRYYSLQSVFAAVDRANRSYNTSPELDKKKADLSAHIAELDKQLAAMDAEIKKSGGEAMKALDQKIAILTPKAKLQRKRPNMAITAPS